MAQKDFVGPLSIDFHSVHAKNSRWHRKGDLSPNDYQLDCIAQDGHAIKWTVEDRIGTTLSTHQSLPNAVKAMIKAGKNLRLPVDFKMADLYAKCLQVTLEKETEREAENRAGMQGDASLQTE